MKNKTFIIAELSANHNQDYDIAIKTIEAVKECGADAVKIQTYSPDTMTINCHNEHFLIDHGTLWDGRYLYELYQDAYTPWEWQKGLKEEAENLGLVFFSTPFDLTAVDFLESLGIPLYKIASFEITDLNLIEYVASKGKPIIISTGIATLADIDDALTVCRNAGNNQITLLKCTSAYPAPVEDANLLTIPNLKQTFNVDVGLSDHSFGSVLPVAAIALGAKVIEKHFILDKKIGGPDAGFSMEPNDFKEMVESIRNAEKALGYVEYKLTDKQKINRKFSRSLFVVKDIKAGESLTEANIRIIRPGDGMHPKYYKQVLGKKARSDIKLGTPLQWDLIG